MNPIEDVIKILSAFDLSQRTDDEVITELKKIGKIALLGLNFKKGSFVVRSRCNQHFVNYSYEDDITYIKDKSKPPQYNRASLHGEPMFYGCVPTHDTDDERYYQVLSIAEVSKVIDKDTDEELEEYATMGKWRIIKNFTATAIASHSDFINENPELKNMHEAY